jgi:putative salt-induced outer membrane protein YdiY
MLAAVMLMALWTGTASADKAVMMNGDQISGTALSMSSGKLVFKAPYADKIVIDWKKVAHLTTDGPMEVSLGKEKSLNGKLVMSREGTLVLQSENKHATVPIRMAEVKVLSPFAGKQEWKLSGGIAAGIVVQSGNTDKQSLNFDSRMELSKRPHRLGLFSDVNYEKNDGSLTDDNVLINLNYDYFISRKWFLFANDKFKRDKFADLTALNAFGGGAGYQFWKSEAKNLSFRLGPNYVFQLYGSEQSFLDGDDGRQYPAAFWGLDFDVWAYKRVLQFFHNSTGLLSFQDGKNWSILTRTGVRVPLFWRLFATLQYDFEYTGQPADRTVSDDGKLVTKLGVKW